MSDNLKDFLAIALVPAIIFMCLGIGAAGFTYAEALDKACESVQIKEQQK